MKVILIRFLIGAVAVSIFAVLGDLFKPKSFAGLFGAAPSVALATLGLTVASEGSHFAVTEAGSMIAGAIAFFVYASCVSSILGTLGHDFFASRLGRGGPRALVRLAEVARRCELRLIPPP